MNGRSVAGAVRLRWFDSASEGAVSFGPVGLMYRMYRYILPGVRKELAFWRKAADRIPDPELRRQAIASMASKRFHCQGGAVYAAAQPEARDVLVRLIVAFQTISDYLDNLCDRSTSNDPDDFRLLHRAMLDAIDPESTSGEVDYYALRRERDDGGYLRALVETCRSVIAALPSFGAVRPVVREWVGLYADLQVYKHLAPDRREEQLLKWWDGHRRSYSALRWNEFAAATGSTIGVFHLFASAVNPRLSPGQVEAIRDAYFPYICALHILLDYLIDQEEDRHGGDLNFCSYYRNAEEAADRIGLIESEARRRARRLPDAAFHEMVIDGLLALYLTDPKADAQADVREVRRRLLRGRSWAGRLFWFNCRWIRAKSAWRPLV